MYENVKENRALKPWNLSYYVFSFQTSCYRRSLHRGRLHWPGWMFYLSLFQQTTSEVAQNQTKRRRTKRTGESQCHAAECFSRSFLAVRKGFCWHQGRWFHFCERGSWCSWISKLPFNAVKAIRQNLNEVWSLGSLQINCWSCGLWVDCPLGRQRGASALTYSDTLDWGHNGLGIAGALLPALCLW